MKYQKKKCLLLLVIKLIEKIQTKLRTKIEKKIGKSIKSNCSKPKTIKNPKIVDIKSAIIEHPKTSGKLSKTLKQAKKIGSGKKFESPLYRETKKSENLLNEKNLSHTYRGYLSIYKAEIFYSFNPELQLKDTESAIKNKLKIYCLNSEGLNS